MAERLCQTDMLHCSNFAKSAPQQGYYALQCLVERIAQLASWPDLNTEQQTHLPNRPPACRYLQPLAMQIVMLPLNLFESQLFKVHVMGQAPQGALARPWKEDNPFAA